MGKRLDPKEADAVMLKAGFQTLEPYVNSISPWRSIHLVCGEIAQPSLSKIKSGRKGCAFCQNRIDPETALNIMLAANIRPKIKYPGAQAPWISECLVCSNEITPTLNGIKFGKGCKYCKKRYVDPDSAVKYMISRNLQPYEPYKTANAPWRCKCLKCGVDVKPSYASIKSGQGCASCAGNLISPEEATKVMNDAGLVPLEPYKHGQYKWPCKCLKCGEVVTPTYSSVQQGQGGCIYCAEKGFDPKKPSYLYILKNDELNAIKVGIGNSNLKNNDRITVFKASGWKLYKKWDFEKGIDAWTTEKGIFQIIRKELRIPQYLTKSEIGYGHGHTETINADLIVLSDLENIVRSVIKQLEK